MPVDDNDLDAFFDAHGLESDDDLVGEIARSYEIGALREGIVKSKAQLNAAMYAARRSGELVSGIDDVTRENLKKYVSSAIDNGWSLGELRQRIDEGGIFGRERAETIARTETAFAHGRGAHEAAKDQEQDEKSWIRGQSEPEDECQDNEDAGWIPIDDDFPSGDDTIPAHPNCLCDVIYRTSSLYSEDDLADDEASNDDEDVISGTTLSKLFAQALTDYSEDQERDDHGRFGSGGGKTPLSETERESLKGESSGSLTESEQLAINGYTGGDYRAINFGLRGGSDEGMAKQIAALDSALGKSSLERDTALYRGYGGAQLEQTGLHVDTFSQLQPGDTYTDKGFASTTTDYSRANTFAGDFGVHVTIEAPSGLGALKGTSYEKEVILPRGLTYQVISNRPADFGPTGDGQARMTVRIIK